MRAPERRITSGILKPPPISTSSPRATITSLPFARAINIKSTAAAQLLTTPAPSAPDRCRSRSAARSCRRPRRPVWGSNSRVEYRPAIAAAARAATAAGRPAEVGVKDHPGGVDHRPQARPPQFTNNLLDSGPAGGGLRDCAATTLRLEDLLDGEANERAAMLGDQGAGRLLLEKLMDARQGS